MILFLKTEKLADIDLPAAGEWCQKRRRRRRVVVRGPGSWGGGRGGRGTSGGMGDWNAAFCCCCEDIEHSSTHLTSRYFDECFTEARDLFLCVVNDFFVSPFSSSASARSES